MQSPISPLQSHVCHMSIACTYKFFAQLKNIFLEYSHIPATPQNYQIMRGTPNTHLVDLVFQWPLLLPALQLFSCSVRPLRHPVTSCVTVTCFPFLSTICCKRAITYFRDLEYPTLLQSIRKLTSSNFSTLERYLGGPPTAPIAFFPTNTIV